ncbi:ATP-dependent Clp protease adapter ClpS [Paracoccus yeei]|jgi:ATP-dependent Clp protease adapter protein ClpS
MTETITLASFAGILPEVVKCAPGSCGADSATGAYIRGKSPYIQALILSPGDAGDVTRPQMTQRPGDREDVDLAVKTKPRTQRPPLYKVLLLNDDFTPMEFVVHVLERLFNMTRAQAIEIMLTVHRKGVAVVGVFSHEIAETKVAQVMELARRQQHPLQCTMEKE